MSEKQREQARLLFADGKIAGGIGVGVGTEEQDCEIAEYMVSVFDKLVG